MFEFIMFFLVAFIAYRLGRSATNPKLTAALIADVITRARIPVVVVDKMEDHFYMFDKDTGQFLVQAPTLEELSAKLLSDKKISLAMVLYPEEAGNTMFYYINGKVKVLK